MGRALKVLGGVLLGGVILVVFLGSWINGQGLAPDELARRCDACMPSWPSYQEDVKAIHSPTVAQWAGHPVALWGEGDTLFAEFALEGFWAESTTAIPVLLRTPESRIIRSAATRRDASHIVYSFPDTGGIANFPWVELHYPHTERRFSLDQRGRWQPLID